jgi:GcrA cell cycle regulator
MLNTANLDDRGIRLKLDGSPRKVSLKRGEQEWTAERLAVLKSMWADGYSQAEIADALGLSSRGAVSGKLSRLGLSKRERKIRRVVLPEVDPTLLLSDVPPERRIPLIDLEPEHCRFFCGDVGAEDGGFCPDHTIAGTSWCLHHYRVTHAPR